MRQGAQRKTRTRLHPCSREVRAGLNLDISISYKCSRRLSSAICAASHLRLPPPPPAPPPREPMLEAPRLPLARALDPLYPLEPLDPPPNASRFPPPLRERSRPPMLLAPPPLGRLPAPIPPLARLLALPPPARLPAPPARLLGKSPPCRPTCCRALA